MKNWRQNRIIGLLTTLIITFVFITCDEDNGKKCLERVDTAIDDINCGGKNCSCSPKLYGYINSIPVYRMSNVTDIQITNSNTFINLTAGYNNTNVANKTNITNVKVSAIYITTVDYVDCSSDPNVLGKYIIFLAYDFDVGMMRTCFGGFNNGELTN